MFGFSSLPHSHRSHSHSAAARQSSTVFALTSVQEHLSAFDSHCAVPCCRLSACCCPLFSIAFNRPEATLLLNMSHKSLSSAAGAAPSAASAQQSLAYKISELSARRFITLFYNLFDSRRDDVKRLFSPQDFLLSWEGNSIRSSQPQLQNLLQNLLPTTKHQVQAMEVQTVNLPSNAATTGAVATVGQTSPPGLQAGAASAQAPNAMLLITVIGEVTYGLDASAEPQGFHHTFVLQLSTASRDAKRHPNAALQSTTPGTPGSAPSVAPSAPTDSHLQSIHYISSCVMRTRQLEDVDENATSSSSGGNSNITPSRSHHAHGSTLTQHGQMKRVRQ